MKNLLIRSLVAAVGIPLVLWLVSRGSWYLMGLVAAIQIVMMIEWSRLWRARGIHLFFPALLVATLCQDYAVISGGEPTSLAVFILSLALLLGVDLFSADRKPSQSLGGSALFLVYIALPLALWNLLEEPVIAARFEPAGALTILLITTWVCDTAAYAVGRLIGKHRLFPAASPNKTLEGFIAGVIGASIVLPVIAALGFASPKPMDYFTLAAIVGFTGQGGDLLESLIKREAQVKDTSSILPGHGGMLDRFDSLLLSTPFFFAYLMLSVA